MSNQLETQPDALSLDQLATVQGGFSIRDTARSVVHKAAEVVTKYQPDPSTVAKKSKDVLWAVSDGTFITNKNSPGHP